MSLLIQSLSIIHVKAAAHQLGPLNERAVYAGGATGSLYVDPSAALEVRPTNDVDVVIELASYSDYSLLDE